MKVTNQPLNDEPKVTAADLTEIDPLGEEAADDTQAAPWQELIKNPAKRFQLMFYFLAGITGILWVQVIWQIAILTIPQQ